MTTWKRLVFEGDAPQFQTVKLTALNNNYVPYHVSQTTGLTNSPIYTENGNVGIGTTSPQATLDITGSLRLSSVAGFGSEYDNGNSGSSKTINWNNGNKQRITLTANCTLSFTAPSPSMATHLTLRLIQDGTGGRTVTWPTSVRWAGGTAPTLSTGANAVDIATFYWNGTNYYGTVLTNFA